MTAKKALIALIEVSVAKIPCRAFRDDLITALLISSFRLMLTAS